MSRKFKMTFWYVKQIHIRVAWPDGVMSLVGLNVTGLALAGTFRDNRSTITYSD